MAGVKFFNSRKIKLFVGYPRGKRNKDQDRTLVIPFRVALDGQIVRSAPDFVKRAFDEIKDGADFVGLKKELENIDCDIFALEEHKRPAVKFARLHLKKLSVGEVKNGEGDTATVLSFSTEYPWDEVVWGFLGDRYKTDVWAQFSSAQASLLDVTETGAQDDGEEEEADSEPDDSDEEVEEEEEVEE